MHTKRTKSITFPIAVKAGSSVVRIYRDRKPSGEYFRVVYHLGGKRHRLNFRDLDSAKTEAAAKAAQLARGDMDAAQLTGKDRLIYGRALEAVREFGIPLDAVALEYGEARKILDGHNLVETARFYMRHHGRGLTGKSVGDAVAELIDTKRLERRSQVYLAELRHRLGSFARAFHIEVRQLSPGDVRDFLNGLKVGPASFNNFRRVLRVFFRFCQARGWLSREVDLLDGTGKRKEALADIEVFTAAELRALLYAASLKVATCIALQAFAGVRSEELLRLTWADLERRKGFVEISAGKAKTQARRLIPILPSLAQWLSIAPRFGEKVWPHSKPYFFEEVQKAADKAGVSWKANGLRHSFISCRLATTQDVAKVALEAGNSPAIIFRHYRELTTEAEAAEWFGIVPAASEASNVVPLAS
jgi:integrase